MDATIATLIAAAIGALSGLGGAFLSGRRQSYLEHQKWLRAREDDLEKDIRLAVANLTRKIAAATHTIIWLTWKAKYQSHKMTQEDISAYDKEMHELLPDIVGSLIIVSAMSKDMYDKMAPLVKRIHTLDAQIAKAAMLFEYSPDSSSESIATHYDYANPFYEELAQKVADIVRSRVILEDV